ncbi:transporter substrate-binding domain-containing protein [Alcanivorax sp. IL1]|uniref:transporter substrate-binding domain-containing protein n=1 Tax=Alcanivorax sp. IL1 TaxID=3396308 RepID=UPI0039C1B9B5
MRSRIFLTVCLLVSLLAGCDKEPGVGEVVSTFNNYEETGDLPALQERGYIRLLAPRFDEPSGLPREGVPAREYQAQAEAFVRHLGLQPRWVYAESFAELGALINAGAADVIVTNYSVTKDRQKTLAFSTPVNAVQEKLVVPAEKADLTLTKLKNLTISVPEGTSYQETAEKLARRHDNISVDILDANLSDEELVEGVESGELAATIIDSNMLDVLISPDGEAAIGPVVNRKRRIAWAVRQDSTELLDRINQYITSERVISSVKEQEKRDWSAIKEHGVLRVITSNNPASYFMWRGELMGFDYDLINDFAKKHRLRVSVVVRDSPSAMFAALQVGEGDVIAASMTVTEDRQKQGWMFSDRYLEVNEQLIGRSDEAPLENIGQLAGRTVAVNPETAYYDTLQKLRESDFPFIVQEVPGASTEMLINAVANGEYDLTMADSHLAAMESTYREDIAVLFEFEPAKQIGWGLRPEQQALEEQLNSYIARHYRGLNYNITYNRYFREKKPSIPTRPIGLAPGKPFLPTTSWSKARPLNMGWIGA